MARLLTFLALPGLLWGILLGILCASAPPACAQSAPAAPVHAQALPPPASAAQKDGAAEATKEQAEENEAEEEEEDAGGALYHVIGAAATVFMRPDSTRPYLDVGMREPVYLLDKKPRWSRVRTADGAEGYVRTHTLSNVWIRVSKAENRLYLYAGTHLAMTAPADFGYNAFSDKARRGSPLRRDDWRTPEGTFYVVRKNPHSRFRRALVLNYPTTEDAERGLRKGLISKRDYHRIIEAQDDLRMPPMDTALGGMIEIHGEGTGDGRNWTHGCVALHNRHLDRLWNRVEVGTPVLIE